MEKKIQLKRYVDAKNMDLKKLSNESAIPYSELKDWYNTSTFDSDQVGVQELTNLSAALDVDISELIDIHG